VHGAASLLPIHGTKHAAAHQRGEADRQGVVERAVRGEDRRVAVRLAEACVDQVPRRL